MDFPPLLHPALELQEVALALPKVELYFELLQNASPHTHTFNQNGPWQMSEQYCVSETTPSCLALSRIFSKQAFDFDTLNTSVLFEKVDFLLGLEEGDFLLGLEYLLSTTDSKGQYHSLSELLSFQLK